jgi:hypothetical protein
LFKQSAHTPALRGSFYSPKLNSKVNSKVNKSGGWLGDLLGFPTQNPTSYLQHVCLAQLKRYTYLYPKTGINHLTEFHAFFAKRFIFKTKSFAAFTFSSFLP